MDPDSFRNVLVLVLVLVLLRILVDFRRLFLFLGKTLRFVLAFGGFWLIALPPELLFRFCPLPP